MRRGRLLLLLGLILALGAALVVVFAVTRGGGIGIGGGGGTAPTDEQWEELKAQLEPTGVPTQEVWVALQPIPRGGEFVEGTLGLRDWPTSNVPPDVIGDKAETLGRVAGTDVVQGMPILRSMLAEKGAAGQAALLVPEGRVAVAFPINEQSSVAYAIQPGDFVDVLAVASFVDLDTDFQTKMPNTIRFFTRREDTDTGQTSLVLLDEYPGAKFERPPGLPEEISGAIVYPSEEQRPRRVAQLTVPAAKVLRVGPWLETAPVQTEGEGETAEGDANQPAPRALPTIVTLAVDPQDALVLLWARKAEMHMELALRAPGAESARHLPEAVNLQYMRARFNIEPPARQDVGLEPEPLITIPTPVPEPTPDQGQ